jgi:hypothetical protein
MVAGSNPARPTISFNQSCRVFTMSHDNALEQAFGSFVKYYLIYDPQASVHGLFFVTFDWLCRKTSYIDCDKPFLVEWLHSIKNSQNSDSAQKILFKGKELYCKELSDQQAQNLFTFTKDSPSSLIEIELNDTTVKLIADFTEADGSVDIDQIAQFYLEHQNIDEPWGDQEVRQLLKFSSTMKPWLLRSLKTAKDKLVHLLQYVNIRGTKYAILAESEDQDKALEHSNSGNANLAEGEGSQMLGTLRIKLVRVLPLEGTSSASWGKILQQMMDVQLLGEDSRLTEDHSNNSGEAL